VCQVGHLVVSVRVTFSFNFSEARPFAASCKFALSSRRGGHLFGMPTRVFQAVIYYRKPAPETHVVRYSQLLVYFYSRFTGACGICADFPTTIKSDSSMREPNASRLHRPRSIPVQLDTYSDALELVPLPKRVKLLTAALPVPSSPESI